MKGPHQNRKPVAKQMALQRRRQRVAAAVIAGKPTITDLAKQEGITRSQLSREANSPQTRLIIRELLGKHHRKIQKLVGMSLKAIEQGFKAHRVLPARDADGDSVTLDGGVDHYIRLTAAKRVLEILEAAQPPKEEAAFNPNLVTWEGFVALYRARVQE